MLISHNDSLLPRIYNARRNISRSPERTDKYRNSQRIILKRNHPFQRSYMNTTLADTDINIYNITNKVAPLRKNPVGMLIDIYAWIFNQLNNPYIFIACTYPPSYKAHYCNKLTQHFKKFCPYPVPSQKIVRYTSSHSLSFPHDWIIILKA